MLRRQLAVVPSALPPGPGVRGVEGKGLFIGEYGCPEQDAHGNTSGDPRAKASWFREAGATIKSWPEVKAAVYSHVSPTSSTASIGWTRGGGPSRAFRDVGSDPYFE